MAYPNAPIYVFNDSGIGIGKGDSDLGFVTGLMEEYKSQPFIPASCADCITSGHLTHYIGWQLDQDPNLKIAGGGDAREIVGADVHTMSERTRTNAPTDVPDLGV